MATYTFGLTSAAVASLGLPDLTVDSTVMDEALEDAASDVGMALLGHEITPSGVTEAATPNDWQWCRQLVLLGASILYQERVGGGATDDDREKWDTRLSFLLKNPPPESYSSSSAGTAGEVITHVAGVAQATIDERRARFPDPTASDWYAT